MAAYRCIITRLNPAVKTPPDYADLDWIAKIFSDASSRAIKLQIEDQTDRTIMKTPSSVTTDYELTVAAAKLLGRGVPGVPIDTIAIILANTYSEDHGALGVMFDLDDRPRQACAVFSGKLASSGRDAKFTTIHELGHVFNLPHQCEPKTYMRQSPETGSAPPDWRQFDVDQMAWLANVDRDTRVQPGGGAFRGIEVNCGSGFLRHDLDLAISTPLRSFSRLDPIELDVRLTLPRGLHRRAVIPDFVDPGCPGFKIWITTPSGERRRFRPRRVYHSSPKSIAIGATKPFARDISLWRSGGGLTFYEQGVHELSVEFDTPSGLLKSNPLAIEILPDRAAGALKERQRLLSRDVQDVLYYRDGSAPEQALRDIEKDLKDRPKQRQHAPLRYALARIETGARTKKTKQTATRLRRLIDPALADQTRLSTRQVHHLERIHEAAHTKD